MAHLFKNTVQEPFTLPEDASYDFSRSREKKSQKDATIRCLLLTSVSTYFGHHYAHLQENKDRVTAFGVLLWICWIWLVAVVGRCVVGCEQCTVVQALKLCTDRTVHRGSRGIGKGKVHRCTGTEALFRPYGP